jgi:hypothetical protein
MKISYAVTLKYEVEIRLSDNNIAGAFVVLETAIDALHAELALAEAKTIAKDQFNLADKLSAILIKINIKEAD